MKRRREEKKKGKEIKKKKEIEEETKTCQEREGTKMEWSVYFYRTTPQSPTWERTKEHPIPIYISTKNEWENRSAWGKNPLVRHS